ncbi:hypothetical protein Hypma_015341 [Hypsizygus marmoreus]|uniref:Uncharacterized protein n=1 Tax=Hypsizygus marmoreus TaxID=39966 RepID=A0A369K4M8_HYPMA|nr:hypothetical protein Hypma_015341 [Hypsizygus marmoreus]
MDSDVVHEMTQPPYYILFSHSSIVASNPGAPSNTLGHPTIQYHYANDSPLALWPQHANEHVLVLDYDPTGTKQPAVQSMSKDLAVSSLKVEEAPGAAAASESDPKNDRMYIVETTASDGIVDGSLGDRKSARSIVLQYKRRNAILRRALLYPDTPGQLSQPSLPVSPQRSES